MLNVYDQNDIFYCEKNSDKYPEGLRKIFDLPPAMYYKGAIEIINQHKNIAVIGSRKASPSGMKLSYETGRLVGMAGINLVNGLALGCDTEALKGALSVGGKCVAVMPCGLEQIQPKSNQRLADEIVEKGGCLLSEYPVGEKLQKYNYVERDRLQSGISQGVLIIEAEKNSGTMHTANFALKQYKRLACYHYKIFEMASGNWYLEESGKAEILKSTEELQEFLTDILQEVEYEQMSLTFD